MDISEIITLLSQLFKNNQNNESPQQQTEQPDYTSQYWQLPDYNTQNTTKENYVPPQSNTPKSTSNIDIQSLVKLITTILELLPKKKPDEPKQKEIYPSYISNLQRTDKYNK